MSALVPFVKLVRFVRSEGGVIVTSQNAWFESASSEEAEDAFEVVEECFLVAGLDRRYLLRVSRKAMNCLYPSMLSGLMGPTLS